MLTHADARKKCVGGPSRGGGGGGTAATNLFVTARLYVVIMTFLTFLVCWWQDTYILLFL